MPLDDFFRKPSNLFDKGSIQPWSVVQGLCNSQIDDTFDLFRANNCPRLDWCEPRYRALQRTEAIESVIKAAQRILYDGQTRGEAAVRFVGPMDSWEIFVTAFPTASDAQFLMCLGEGSYESFAHAVRREFRNLCERWERRDFAHWIILLDEKNGEAAVHLHTVWNLMDQLSWFTPAKDGSPPVLLSAPCIVPIELARDCDHMHMQMLQDDLEAARR